MEQSHNEWWKVMVGRAVVGVALIVVQFTRPNFGSSSAEGAEALGFNAFAVVMHAAGIWLLYSGVKPAIKQQLASAKASRA